jgi:hypothetical protein
MKKCQIILTAERLREVLSYDQETGIFTRLVSATNRVNVGDVAGYVHQSGYRLIRVDSGRYLAHRLAWLYVYGAFPADGMDHINGDRADNRICNLREATDAENNQNKISERSGTSKYLGVSWSKRDNKWRATIHVNRKQHYLGQFATEEEACAAYCAAKSELHTFNPVPRKTMEQTL